MQLNDRLKTNIIMANVCVYRVQDEQMAGHGGLVIRFTGGVETLEYDGAEKLDLDIKMLEAAAEKIDNPVYYYTTPEGTGPR
jgi:hypothetical protein